MTKEELNLVRQGAKRFSSKWQLAVDLAWGMGLRTAEIAPMNIKDFKQEFRIVGIVHAKSHLYDDRQIPEWLRQRIIQYITHNSHLLKDGYLFPYYTSRRQKPHVTTNTMANIFYKLREYLKKEHPSFQEGWEMSNGDFRHRIGWHSLRRFHQTYIMKKTNNIFLLRDLMRYKDTRSCNPYIDPYQVWEREREILEETFEDLVQEIVLNSPLAE